jgi:hypothetical protein
MSSNLIVVATGRFQRIHVGSGRYLNTAKYIAEALRGELYVTTGPFDAELPDHGERVPGGLKRRLLSFSERQFIISRQLGIPEANILPQHASPHHGQDGLELWSRTFFNSLISSGRLSRGDLQHATTRRVVLFVATKADDYQDFYGTGQLLHYSDVVKLANPGIDLLDYSRLLKFADTEKLSASRIEDGQLVPAMQMVEELIASGECKNLRDHDSLIEAAIIRFGSEPISRSQAKQFILNRL